MSRDPLDPVDDYTRVVAAVPAPTAREERDLLGAVKKGSAGAKKRLIEAHLHLVLPIAARYEGRGVPLADLIEEGNIGLPRAIELFEPSADGDFSGFAARQIEHAITSAIE